MVNSLDENSYFGNFISQGKPRPTPWGLHRTAADSFVSKTQQNENLNSRTILRTSFCVFDLFCFCVFIFDADSQSCVLFFCFSGSEQSAFQQRHPPRLQPSLRATPRRNHPQRKLRPQRALFRRSDFMCMNKTCFWAIFLFVH